MNDGQKILLERTLFVLGGVGVGMFCLIMGNALLQVAISADIDLSRVIYEMFDYREAAFIVWPPFTAGLFCLWLRSLSQASRLA